MTLNSLPMPVLVPPPSMPVKKHETRPLLFLPIPAAMELREFAEYILKSQHVWDDVLRQYLGDSAFTLRQ